MKLASNYSFKKLEAAISEKISSMINFDNVFDLLNKAVANNMEGLTNVSLTFMDEDPLEILESDYLCSLTQKSMVKLLERDSFGAPEIDIFKSVAKWCKNNKDEKNLVMQCVRLSSLTNEEILTVVFPSKLVESEKLLTILAQAVDEKPKMSKSRQYCFGFKEEENLATREHRTKAISGVNSDLLLTGNRNVDLYAHHIINDQEGITIKLRIPCYVNHIYMGLWDKDKNYYSYYIEVSTDRKQWKKIVDYSRYHCRSFQKLYFERVFVRYIRIVGTKSSSDNIQQQIYQTQITQYMQMPVQAQMYIPNTMQYYNGQRPQAFVQPAAVPFPLYSMTQSHPSQSTMVSPNANKPLPAMRLSQPQTVFQRQHNKRRAKAIPTIDPDTGVDRLDEVYEQQNNSYPPSGESSARQTPQPSVNNVNKEIQAVFAKQVLQVANNETSIEDQEIHSVSLDHETLYYHSNSQAAGQTSKLDHL